LPQDPALSIFVGMIFVGFLGYADAVRSDGGAGALIAQGRPRRQGPRRHRLALQEETRRVWARERDKWRVANGQK
jgi:hypothetical protein